MQQPSRQRHCTVDAGESSAKKVKNRFVLLLL
jgi:hypothetical protein